VTAADLDADGWEVALDEAVGELGGSRFAVRSSGAAEDLTDASYAGLYETYLNVPADELAQAVRRCFAAAGADRVQAYQERHGGSPAAMAVLVQAMVDPVAAGVAFTAHPVTGDAIRPWSPPSPGWVIGWCLVKRSARNGRSPRTRSP
jgi:rifampicin phosphotransferase